MLQVHNVSKFYGTGEQTVRALDSVSCAIGAGSVNFIVGQSGSGKSTLLRLIGLLDQPSEGTIVFMNREVVSLSDDEAADFRAKSIGYIFQSFNLLPVLSVAENVAFPLLLHAQSAHDKAALTHEVLQAVGLEGLGKRGVHEISGGQCQRVAIARALVTKPALIIADEPTASLDSRTSADIMNLLCSLNTIMNTTLIICTHNESLIPSGSTILRMADGRVQSHEVTQ